MYSTSAYPFIQILMEQIQTEGPTEPKIILVTGATGSQGGSVARHLLKSGKYHVRCFVRDPKRADAKELARLGGEIVEGDFEDQVSIENAMKGVYGVFANVNFWENPDDENWEIQCGKLLANCAKKAGVLHYIYSGLDHAEQMTGGRYKVPHFDSKAQVAQHIRQIGLPFTEVRLASYMENCFDWFERSKRADVAYELTFPMQDKPIDLFSVDDTGGVVLAIFEKPQEWIGKTIGVAGDSLTGQQMCDVFSRIVGKRAEYKPMTFEEYNTLGEYADKLSNMYRFYCDFAGKLRDIQKTRELYPNTKTFEQWMHDHAVDF